MAVEAAAEAERCSRQLLADGDLDLRPDEGPAVAAGGGESSWLLFVINSKKS